LGQKQTSGWRPLMSALPPIADMVQHDRDVRFVPIATKVRRKMVNRARRRRNPRHRRGALVSATPGARRADLTLEQNRAWRVPRLLDAEAMHAAARCLIGRHDFTTFRSTECQAKSPVKTLSSTTGRSLPSHRASFVQPVATRTATSRTKSSWKYGQFLTANHVVRDATRSLRRRSRTAATNKLKIGLGLVRKEAPCER
jgi:hypothetical protein